MLLACAAGSYAYVSSYARMRCWLICPSPMSARMLVCSYARMRWWLSCSLRGVAHLRLLICGDSCQPLITRGCSFAVTLVTRLEKFVKPTSRPALRILPIARKPCKSCTRLCTGPFQLACSSQSRLWSFSFEMTILTRLNSSFDCCIKNPLSCLVVVMAAC